MNHLIFILFRSEIFNRFDIFKMGFFARSKLIKGDTKTKFKIIVKQIVEENIRRYRNNKKNRSKFIKSRTKPPIFTIPTIKINELVRYVEQIAKISQVKERL